MLEESLAFRSISPKDQNRFEDRISFLYLEYAKVVQKTHGVVALSSNKIYGNQSSELQIPIGGIALLSLGPGTSISNAALTSCARSGCLVQIAGGGGYPSHSTISPLTASARWAIAQAKVVASTTESKKVAKLFYKKQFDMDDFEGSIAQMRGIEGSIIKRIYASEARKMKISGWRRDTRSDDNVNVALNIANGLLYGLGASITGALAMSDALGIIHRGNRKAFLFDVADLYKPSITIPLAFSLANSPREDVPKLARSGLRRAIREKKLLEDISSFITNTFRPYLPENEDDSLIGGVEAHVNYGKE